MTEILLPITVAVCSLILGHILTRAWDRARPFTVIHGIDPCFKTQDLAFIDEKLAELTSKSWFSSSLPPGERPVAELADAVRCASAYLTANHDGQDRLRSVVAALQDSQSNQDTVSALKTLLTHHGLVRTLEMLLVRGELDLPDKKPGEGQELVKVFETDEHEGAFFIELPDTYVRLGRGISNHRVLADRLRPLVNAIQIGDQVILSQMLKTASYHLQEQVDAAREITEIGEPLLNLNSRWDTQAVLVNYGKSSLVLWPEATLQVRDRRTNAAFTCKCALADEDLKPIRRLTVVPPDGSIDLHIITDLRQREMEHGNTMREVYEHGTGRAAVSFKITHRSSSHGTPFLSEWMQFAVTSKSGAQQEDAPDCLQRAVRASSSG